MEYRKQIQFKLLHTVILCTISWNKQVTNVTNCVQRIIKLKMYSNINHVNKMTINHNILFIMVQIVVNKNFDQNVKLN